jgi:hypothetical protein
MNRIAITMWAFSPSNQVVLWSHPSVSKQLM